MSGRRVAARLALRRVLEERRRSLLLLSALAVPLAVAVLVSVLWATSQLSDEQRRAALTGRSAAELVDDGYEADGDVESTLGAGLGDLWARIGVSADAAPEVRGGIDVGHGGDTAPALLLGLDLADRIHDGRVRVHEGRPAEGVGEVVLSEALARRLGAELGDEVSLGPAAAPAVVVGTGVNALDTSLPFVVTDPAGAAVALDVDGKGALTGAEIRWQLREPLPPTEELAEHLYTLGWRYMPLGEPGGYGPPSDAGGRLIVAGAALGLSQVGLLLGAAYTIVVRSDRRLLGLLAAAGAGPRVRRATVVYQGLWLGVAAVVSGGAAGVLGAWALKDSVAGWRNQLWPALDIDPLVAGSIALVGVATPTAAAAVAARGIGGDVVAAVRDLDAAGQGARARGAAMVVGSATVSALLLVLGRAVDAAPVLVAAAAALVVTTGLGMRAALPSVASRGHRLGLLGRMVLRMTGRAGGRAATLATVLASLTVVAGVVLGVLAAVASDDDYVPATPEGSAFAFASRPPQDATLRGMAEALGVEDVVGMRIAAKPAGQESVWQSGGPLTIDDPAAGAARFGIERRYVVAVETHELEAVLGRPLTAEEDDAVAAGSALVLDRRLAPDGTVEILHEGPAEPGLEPRVERLPHPAVVAQEASPYARLPLAYVTDEGLERLDAVTEPYAFYLYAPVGEDGEAISTGDESVAASLLAGDIGETFFMMEVERGPPGADWLPPLTAGVTGLAAVVAIVLAFVTVSLSTRELRPDLSALAAAGAPKRFRSRLNGAHASLVVALGFASGLLVLVALLPVLWDLMGLPWVADPWLRLVVVAVAGTIAAALAGTTAGSRVETLLRRTG